MSQSSSPGDETVDDLSSRPSSTGQGLPIEMIAFSPFWFRPCSRMAAQVPTGISLELGQRGQDRKQQLHGAAKARYRLISPATTGGHSND